MPQVAPSIDITIELNSTHTSAKDTLLVKRDKANAWFKLKVKKPAGTDLNRLYVFKKVLDPLMVGMYETVEIASFTKDGNNNYYYLIPTTEKDTASQQISVPLRVNDPTAVLDEYYCVYTTNIDYTGPESTDGVIIGPAQFYIKYGKLTEYQSIRLYNSFSANTNHRPALDVVNVAYKTAADALADQDLYENTDGNALFLGKFKSMNGTSFVKASPSFPYANATDKEVEIAYSLGTFFTETPDSVKIGDIYLMQLRGDEAKYAAMKILYVSPEDGQTGNPHDQEYLLFSIRK